MADSPLHLHASSPPILPGGTIGILGSGQLGRMLALVARRMGYRVHVFSPDRDSPTGQIADLEITASYEDLDAVRAFALGVDVMTLEFENIPEVTIEAASEYVPVRPGNWVLHITQNRLREKRFLSENGLPVAPFAPVRNSQELHRALEEIGYPSILKTARFGYDGKGQARIENLQEGLAAWTSLGQRESILEGYVPFSHEISVVAARGVGGRFAHYGAIENLHWNHILDISLAPARIPDASAARAAEMAQLILEKLDVIGVLCVEFFLMEDGELLVNELAPRPHNSGHLTIEACATSQFEQQLRAVCGLPLGSTAFHRPAAMANLLGHLWKEGEPNWQALYELPGGALHLYGKAEARLGRKMGHLTALGDSVDEARRCVLAARQALSKL